MSVAEERRAVIQVGGRGDVGMVFMSLSSVSHVTAAQPCHNSNPQAEHPDLRIETKCTASNHRMSS